MAPSFEVRPFHHGDEIKARHFHLIQGVHFIVLHFQQGYDREVDLSLRRAILGEFLGRPADSIEWKKTNHGKPYLPNSKLHWSVSHSGDYWALAVSEASPLGVDVERWHGLDRLERIAMRMFLPEENEFWRSFPQPVQKEQAILQLWTRKEAYIKAKGSHLFQVISKTDVLHDHSDCLFETVANPGALVFSLARLIGQHDPGETSS